MRLKENIKELFFNHSTKHWHFNDIQKTAKLSATQTNEWLKRLIKEGLIKRVKPRGKAPYYITTHSEKFKSEKRVYALKKFDETGFLAHLASLKNAKTVIIFGSFARADWHDESDIDLFIYGNADDFDKGLFETKLDREIQVFNYEDKKSVKRLEPSVIPNILAGLHIKGGIEPFEVTLHA